MPYRPFYPSADVPVVQVAIRGERIGRRTGVRVPLVETVTDTAGALLQLLREKPAGGFADRLTQHYRRVRGHLDDPAEARPHDAPMRPQHVAAAVDRPAEGDTIFAADVGTPTVWAARHLTMNGHRQLIGSFNQASWPTRCRRPSARRRPRAGGGRWWHRAGTAGSACCWAT
ncbi:hypothetical protein ACOZCI_32555 [Streptomyces griseoincarnatus]